MLFTPWGRRALVELPENPVYPPNLTSANLGSREELQEHRRLMDSFLPHLLRYFLGCPRPPLGQDTIAPPTVWYTVRGRTALRPRRQSRAASGCHLSQRALFEQINIRTIFFFVRGRNFRLRQSIYWVNSTKFLNNSVVGIYCF